MQGIVGDHCPRTGRSEGERDGSCLHQCHSTQKVDPSENLPGIRQRNRILINRQDAEVVDRQDQCQAGACASADLKDGCLRVPDQRGHEFPFPEDAKLLPLSLARARH